LADLQGLQVKEELTDFLDQKVQEVKSETEGRKAIVEIKDCKELQVQLDCKVLPVTYLVSLDHLDPKETEVTTVYR
jgi:hypothetical protein